MTGHCHCREVPSRISSIKTSFRYLVMGRRRRRRRKRRKRMRSGLEEGHIRHLCVCTKLHGLLGDVQLRIARLIS